MRVVRYLAAVLGFLMLPMSAAAQISTAGVSGTVVDESKAVLPGVSIVATDLDTGRTYETVSDARGIYQLPPLPPGAYKIVADVAGFARTEIPKIELLVGQHASLNLTMRISSVEESLTVRSEAPLVDLNSTQVAGNIDRRQMEAMSSAGTGRRPSSCPRPIQTCCSSAGITSSAARLERSSRAAKSRIRAR